MMLKKHLLLNFGLFFITAVVASDLRRIVPRILKIREGEDFQLRLSRALRETTSCYVKTPSLTSYDLGSEKLDSEHRISYWTENEECGVLIRSVTKQDEGMWRLTAKNSTQTLVDSTFVEVLDKVDLSQRHYSVEVGSLYSLILDEQSMYCQIHHPHTGDALFVGGQCKVDINQPTSAVEGNWSATAGVIGQLQEVPLEAELNVFRKKLSTGYIRNNNYNTISAYCNLKNSEKGFQFCRFSKPDSAQIGFQLSEGLHSGRYGYYGAGLENGECGITIGTPSDDDYGRWLCTVATINEEPFSSYVWINRNIDHAAVVTAEVVSTNSITTTLNDILQLRCNVSVPITYCWFSAPNGEIFTPKQTVAEENASYRYIGHGFGQGQCGMEITKAEKKHEGQWMCHMGPEPSGFELTSTIHARISETPLAATNQHMIIRDEQILTLECRTVPEQIAINYCRFLMPDGTGIHVSDEITENNPLIRDGVRYWYSGVGLQLGHCGLNVNAISSRHLGNWTCATRLESSDANTEVFDTIIVEQIPPSNDNLTAAATTGIVSGVLILLVTLVAGSMYIIKKIRRKRLQGSVHGTDTISTEGNSRSSTSSNSDISLQEMTSDNARTIFQRFQSSNI